MLGGASVPLLMYAGALHAQVGPPTSESLHIMPGAEVVTDSVRPSMTLDSMTLDSVRPVRSAVGPCGRPVPMPNAKPSADSIEMPRAAPSRKTLAIPTIRCDLTRTVQGSQPALRFGPVEGTAPADSVAPPDPE